MSENSRPLVLNSIEDETGLRCVDIFRRDDGSFGFEEYRREPEEAGLWTRIGSFRVERYANEAAALEAARSAVPWLRK